MTMAASLIEVATGRFDRLIADRGCDTNAIRSTVAGLGAEVVILYDGQSANTHPL